MNMNMCKKSIWYALVLLISGIFIGGCSSNNNEVFIGDWKTVNAFPGSPRSDAVTFTIDGVVYVGTGYDLENDERLSDFWKYEADKDTWTQIASLPNDSARNHAIAFSSDTKGYVGLGYNGENALSDFYEYDPAADTWTRKRDFAGGGRYQAFAFYVDGKGYVGAGYDSKVAKNDFYAYNIESDEWEVKAIVAGRDRRRDAMAFILNGEAYVFGGVGNNLVFDFVKYDVQNDKWITLNAITNADSNNSFDDNYQSLARYNGVAFALNGKAYVTTGINGSTGKETWEYDPVTDIWSQKTDFEGDSRSGAVAFTVNNKAYVAFGKNSSKSFYDVWNFVPDAEYDSSTY